MEGGSWKLVKKNWTFPRYYAMIDWWTENGPPVYVSVAGYLGLIKKKKSKSGKTVGSGNLNDLLKMAGNGGMIM
jgi:hypothetical protein